MRGYDDLATPVAIFLDADAARVVLDAIDRPAPDSPRAVALFRRAKELAQRMRAAQADRQDGHGIPEELVVSSAVTLDAAASERLIDILDHPPRLTAEVREMVRRAKAAGRLK